MAKGLFFVRSLTLLLVALATSLVSAQQDCHQNVDYLSMFGVRTNAPSATPACPTRPPDSPPDTAFQITASDYGSIDGDILLGDDFPFNWCMLSSVNCDPSQAGTLMYYEDGNRFGYSMDISNGQLTFGMRGESYSASGQLCDNSWNQFSVCYDGGLLIMTTDCGNAQLLGRQSDPDLSTTTGSLTIFSNSSGGSAFSGDCQELRIIPVSNIAAQCNALRISNCSRNTTYMCETPTDPPTIGVTIQNPSNFTYRPGLTPLPIALSCDVYPVAGWRVNDTAYFLNDLMMGTVPGHNATQRTIFIINPVNNTEYVCTTGSTRGTPYYIFVAVSSSVITATPMLMCTSEASQLYNITVTCTIHPDSIADQCVAMVMADDRVTRTGIAPITNRTATVTISGLQCGVTYNITAEGALNGTLVGPGSPHGNVAAGPCPVIAIDDESNDELSIGAAVAISVVVTFVITLVVTALITYVITGLYNKRNYIKKSVIRQEGDSHALTEDTKSYDATTRANIAMDTDPAYETVTTIKMDTNPAYTATSH